MARYSYGDRRPRAVLRRFQLLEPVRRADERLVHALYDVRRRRRGVGRAQRVGEEAASRLDEGLVGLAGMLVMAY